MRLTLADGTYFKDSISIISDLVNEACFKVSKDGLELVAMDPANVAMVVFRLLASSFAEYEVEQDAKLAINLVGLKQVLRRAKPSDVLSLEVVDNKLKVTMRSATTRTFSVPIIDLEQSSDRIPKLSFPVQVVIPSEQLNSAIEDADVAAESVMFVAEPSKFCVLAEGDTTRAHVEIPSSGENSIKMEGDRVRSKYSIEYLKKMIAGSKLADKVSLSFNQDYPLRLDYSVVDKVSLSFILAPRVDND